MTKPEDYDYFTARAERERELARNCDDPGAAFVHYRMADEYERRVQALAARSPANSLSRS